MAKSWAWHWRLFILEQKLGLFLITAAAGGTARREKESIKAQKLTLYMFYREKLLGGLLSVNSPSSAFSSSFRFCLWLDSNRASQCAWCFTQKTKCIQNALGLQLLGTECSQLEPPRTNGQSRAQMPQGTFAPWKEAAVWLQPNLKSH